MSKRQLVRRIVSRSLLRSIYKSIASSRKFVIGLAMLLAIISMSLVSVLTLPYDPEHFGSFPKKLPPSMDHILGTNLLGRDVFGELVTGILVSLRIGLVVAAIGTIIGSLIGFLSGYHGGIVGSVLGGFTDIFMTFPMFPLLILISASVRQVSILMMTLILSVFSWARASRQVRAQTLSLKKRDFIYISKLSGMGSMEIIYREIMPHMLQWMAANFIGLTLGAILSETGLTLLGLGPQDVTTVGRMIYWANSYQAMFRGMWWWWMPPVFTLIYIFISLYLMSTGLDEVINPRTRKYG